MGKKNKHGRAECGYKPEDQRCLRKHHCGECKLDIRKCRRQVRNAQQ